MRRSYAQRAAVIDPLRVGSRREELREVGAPRVGTATVLIATVAPAWGSPGRGRSGRSELRQRCDRCPARQEEATRLREVLPAVGQLRLPQESVSSDSAGAAAGHDAPPDARRHPRPDRQGHRHLQPRHATAPARSSSSASEGNTASRRQDPRPDASQGAGRPLVDGGSRRSRRRAATAAVEANMTLKRPVAVPEVDQRAADPASAPPLSAPGTQAKEKRPALCGASLGYREERYVFGFWR